MGLISGLCRFQPGKKKIQTSPRFATSSRSGDIIEDFFASGTSFFKQAMVFRCLVLSVCLPSLPLTPNPLIQPLMEAEKQKRRRGEKRNPSVLQCGRLGHSCYGVDLGKKRRNLAALPEGSRTSTYSTERGNDIQARSGCFPSGLCTTRTAALRKKATQKVDPSSTCDQTGAFYSFFLSSNLFSAVLNSNHEI